MRRRPFVRASATAIGTALAGCSTLAPGDGGGDGDPTDSVESLAAAYRSGDFLGSDAIHPSGPLAAELPPGAPGRSLTIRNATVGARSDANATVRATVSVGSVEERWREPRTFEVRQIDGDWRVWSMRTGPEIALAAYVAAVDAGRGDAALEVLHPESPDRGWIQEVIPGGPSLSLEAPTLAAFDPEEATIDATVTETVDGVTATRDRSIELRRTDDGWTVWSLPFGPVVAVFRFARVINENDQRGYERAIHPDGEAPSPDAGIVVIYREFAIEAITRLSMDGDGATDDEATVDARVRLQYLDQTMTQSARFEVRAYEGEWRVFDLGGGA